MKVMTRNEYAENENEYAEDEYSEVENENDGHE